MVSILVDSHCWCSVKNKCRAELDGVVRVDVVIVCEAVVQSKIR